MKISPELIQTYAGLSSLGESYLDFIVKHEGNRVPLRLSDYPVPPSMASYHVELQPVPLLVDKAYAESTFREATCRVVDLVKKLMRVVFDNDAGAIADYYGFKTPDRVRQALQGAEFGNNIIARNDFIMTRDGLKCLEVNATSTLGGWFVPFFTDMYLNHFPVSEFFARHSDKVFSTPDTLGMFFEYLVSSTRKLEKFSGSRVLNLAIISKELESDVSKTRQAMVNHFFSSSMNKLGLEGELVITSSADDIRLLDDSLFIRGKPIHTVVTSSADELNLDILRAFSLGNVYWPDNLLCYAYNDKSNFALLHKYRDSEHFTDDDRRIIDSYIPRSWLLSDKTLQLEGETVNTAEFVLAGQKRLIIKDIKGKQGDNVFIGPKCSEQEWRDIIASALEDGQWLVQEYCESAPFIGQCGEHGLAEYDHVWGLFSFADSYAGGSIRMMTKAGTDGVINAAKGAKEGLIIQVDELNRSTG
ncbi:hypothetical protein SG34_031250 [Thalassomonas viridans]|uniref:Glutathionylspermidine synthase pre-ATP-grasp-like domain-containing protein n=1 Tax=Thalassomonas viridans TaxID=137584 RepID=A0AAE9ZGF3_9GAMM|nr:hypothetical protein [Thalassomonas viridans]WDE09242.1 hypothetical protein SG34_031250 [Thalassomonas viridans]